MRRIDFRIVLGALLIVAGGLGFLQALGFLENASDLFWGLAFLAGGAAFLFILGGGQWWAVIPGLVLAGLGMVILLPDALEDLGGAVFLGSIGLSFWVVYLTDRRRWWAIFPGGILFTLAVVSALPEWIDGADNGGIFFAGLAATFLLVALLSGNAWSYWPAAGVGAFAVLLLATSELSLASYLGAAALIGAGVFIIWRSLTARE